MGRWRARINNQNYLLGNSTGRLARFRILKLLLAPKAALLAGPGNSG